MIWRRLKTFSKLAMFWVLMKLREDFSARALKCRCDDEQLKTNLKR